MADSSALFDDESSAESKPTEESTLFGETTEISLESDDKKGEEEVAEKDAGEETKEKADTNVGGAASVDVTNLSEDTKQVDAPKPQAEVKIFLS